MFAPQYPLVSSITCECGPLGTTQSPPSPVALANDSNAHYRHSVCYIITYLFRCQCPAVGSAHIFVQLLCVEDTSDDRGDYVSLQQPAERHLGLGLTCETVR